MDPQLAQRSWAAATLSEAGYQVWMYSPFPTWNNQYTDHFWYNVDIYEEDLGFADAGFYDLIHIWLASLAPNFLTNEALPVAAALRDWIFVTLTGKARPLSISKGLHPYAGMTMLRRLARDEHLRPVDGQYVYAHAALPHAPFVLDEDCRSSASGAAVTASSSTEPICSRRNAHYGSWPPSSMS